MIKAAFLSVVPSPYQRDLFTALARHPEINLRVFYMERAAPDSPWPEKPLAEYESILPGSWFSIGRARCHFNWALPRVEDYDVLVLNTLMSLTGQWMLRAKLSAVPWIFWGERLRPRRTGWRQALHDQATAPLNGANAIAGIGSRATRDYAERFSRPRHFNIPYYCDLKPFLDTPRRPSDGKTVFLFCGQMIARKGLDLLLAAFARLVEKNSEVRLLLVGREADLPVELAKLPAPARDRIRYEGFQSPEALPRYFAQADVFILPSRYDGWGVVVNQALAAGLALICSDAVGAAHDLIESGKNGCTFPSENADALFTQMQQLAADPTLRQSWGEASRGAAQAWHPEAGASKWVEAFHTVLDR